jgi:hypothetical protein
MDRGRLEELKRLLNKQRSNTKQSLDRELDAENSNAKNSDTSKSVNSNLNVLNFDASDLNNKNSKALNSNDKNSDGPNLNAERGRKFQNLDPDNATLFKNSKARDYDKDPIILKDYATLYVVSLSVVSLIFGGAVTFTLKGIFDNENFIDLLIGNGVLFGIIFFMIGLSFLDFKKDIVVLKNRCAEFRTNDAILHTTTYQNLKEVVKKPISYYMDLSNLGIDMKVKIAALALICIIAFLLDVFPLFLGLVVFSYIGIFFSNLIFCFLITNRRDRRFSVFPLLIIEKPYLIANNIYFIPNYCALITFKKSEYEQLKEYFLNLHNINIDDVDKIYF